MREPGRLAAARARGADHARAVVPGLGGPLRPRAPIAARPAGPAPGRGPAGGVATRVRDRARPGPLPARPDPDDHPAAGRGRLRPPGSGSNWRTSPGCPPGCCSPRTGCRTRSARRRASCWPGCRAGERAAVTYSLRSDLRGRYTVGSAAAAPGGPVRDVRDHPLVHRDRPAGRGPAHLAAEPGAGRRPVGGHRRVAGPQRGGDRRGRRGHPASTGTATTCAGCTGGRPRKRGELMVRREEQPRQMRATVLLDCRRDGHRGEGLASSLRVGASAPPRRSRCTWPGCATASGCCSTSARPPGPPPTRGTARGCCWTSWPWSPRAVPKC